MPVDRVSSIDVSRHPGVSQSSVSRTFTPGASVGAATREKVLRAAQALGYEPNALARSLITGRSRIIGLVVSQLDNLFYPAGLEHLSRRLQADGFHLLMFVADEADSDALVENMLQYRVDGIVLGAVTLSSALAQRCTAAGIPVVLFNRVMARRRGSPAVSSVRGDNVRGGRLLAEHLLDMGHSRIAFIAGREDASTNLERERGFVQGLAQRSQHLFARAVGGYDAGQAAEATRALFRSRRKAPDAVFAASDQMALAVIDTLRHQIGARVPEEVSVVGFDNVPQSSWPAYQLTTFEQPVVPMVEAAVSLLLDQIRSGALRPRSLIVRGQLCVRATTRTRIRASSNRLASPSAPQS
ncbi:MAG: LacI family DNA-binding transcriptional regulator [Betaproteobacteria bacterium]